jgi:serine/threonine-protein kinase
MTIARAHLALVAAVAVISAATPARAQSVEAEALFRDGKRLMKEGKIAAACDKLEASNRLESSVGTLLNLADCREKNKQLATAWETFLKAATTAKQAGKPDKREAEARRRAALLEPRLAYLTISVPDAVRVDGMAIKRNGVAVDAALWNTPVPVDAGVYEIAVTAPGRAAWSTKIEIKTDGQKANVDVPAKENAPPPKPIATTPPPKPVAPPPPPKVAASTEPSPPPEDHVDEGAHPGSFTGMRKAAVAAAVVGVAGIAVGAIYGSKAQDLENQSDMLCPGTTCTNAMAVQLNADARSDATIANIGMIGGGVLVAGAAVMWFVGAPKVAGEQLSVAPLVRGDEVGFAIGGSF